MIVRFEFYGNSVIVVRDTIVYGETYDFHIIGIDEFIKDNAEIVMTIKELHHYRSTPLLRIIDWIKVTSSDYKVTVTVTGDKLLSLFGESDTITVMLDIFDKVNMETLGISHTVNISKAS